MVPLPKRRCDLFFYMGLEGGRRWGDTHTHTHTPWGYPVPGAGDAAMSKMDTVLRP